MSQNSLFKKKIYQSNTCFKIMPKLGPHYRVTKTVCFDDYDFKFFKIVKTLVSDCGFRLKVKTVIVDYDFNHLKNFKIIVNNYSFYFISKTVVHQLRF